MNVGRLMVGGLTVFTALAVLAACTSQPAGQVTRAAEPFEPAPTPAAEPAPVAPKTPEPAQAQASITRVDPELVCMVNNHYMGKAQIPVQVEGKTYFGCCDMCKTKLAQDPQSRAATDPVSGKTVDKAVAVIGREASGTVVYFENEQNLQRYAAR